MYSNQSKDARSARRIAARAEAASATGECCSSVGSLGEPACDVDASVQGPTTQELRDRLDPARDREIVAARVIVTCPGRNFVTLKIETRSGVYGLGDATLNGRELAVASYLTST